MSGCARLWAGLAIAVLAGVAYTAFSEWRNVYRLGYWAYTDAMPARARHWPVALMQWLLYLRSSSWACACPRYNVPNVVTVNPMADCAHACAHGSCPGCGGGRRGAVHGAESAWPVGRGGA